jgi:trans-feruloyl-CoA hydratase/vanillin synthase
MRGAKLKTITVEKEDGITWVIWNRPEKKNAFNPALIYEMDELILDLETDDDTKVIVLTGAGDSWSSGMDMKEYFRDSDTNPAQRFRSFTMFERWAGDLLSMSRKPSIAMVNGYVFGGAFIPLVNCDFAIAAEDAVFGLSEVNWGVIPGGAVAKVLGDTVNIRDALYYAMTGETFDGKRAAELKLVTYAVPRKRLRGETVALARKLMEKNPTVLAYTKQAVKAVRKMSNADALEYLMAKGTALRFADASQTRDEGIKRFIDDKSFRPGFQAIKGKDGGRNKLRGRRSGSG